MARADFALTQTYNQESDFTFDSNYIQFDSVLGLKLLDNPGQDFTEDFADDTDHTYDNTKSEFSGGKWQQKDQRTYPTADFEANYNSSIDANRGGGTLTGTAYGGASILSGELDLAHNDVRYVTYSATDNVKIIQTGTVLFKYTPNYSGSPASDMSVVLSRKADGDNDNLILLRHSTSGEWLLYLHDATGSAILSGGSFGAWSPTSSVQYEIALCIDVTTGAIRLFIDGTQQGSTLTDTGTRDSSTGQLAVGTNANYTDVSNFKIDDLLFFDTVLFTSNYTSGYSVPDYTYTDAYDILPEMEYTGAGTLVSFDSVTYTKTGSLKIALQIGRSGVWSYWNGSAWVTGDGTKDYMCTIEDFASNVSTLDIEGEIYGQFKIFLPESETIGDIDELEVSLTAQIYPMTNPSFETTNGLTADELLSISISESISGSDNIKYIIKRDDDYLYWDGSAWSTSDETYSQSNVYSDISTNIASINNDDENIYYIKGFFHSNDGTTTPTLASIIIKYFEIDFVVEDGTSKTDSTSYATIAQFFQYWINKGTDYSSEGIVDIKQWLNEATEYLDITYRFEGELSDYDQALEWPRTGVIDRYGYELAYDEVPQEIIDATCYLAAQAKSGSLSVVDEGVKSATYGPVSKTFTNSEGTKIYKAVDKMIKYLTLQGKIMMRVN